MTPLLNCSIFWEVTVTKREHFLPSCFQIGTFAFIFLYPKMTKENLYFSHVFWGMDWQWRVWCGIEWLQRNYSATIWSQPLSPCSGNSGCLPSQGFTQLFKNVLSWQGLKTEGGVQEGGDFFLITSLDPSTACRELFLFVQSCLQLGVRTSRKIRSTLEINFSSLYRIFSSLGTAA